MNADRRQSAQEIIIPYRFSISSGLHGQLTDSLVKFLSVASCFYGIHHNILVAINGSSPSCVSRSPSDKRRVRQLHLSKGPEYRQSPGILRNAETLIRESSIHTAWRSVATNFPLGIWKPLLSQHVGFIGHHIVSLTGEAILCFSSVWIALVVMAEERSGSFLNGSRSPLQMLKQTDIIENLCAL